MKRIILVPEKFSKIIIPQTLEENFDSDIPETLSFREKIQKK
jgi:hypothetical protein